MIQSQRQAKRSAQNISKFGESQTTSQDIQQQKQKIEEDSLNQMGSYLKKQKHSDQNHHHIKVSGEEQLRNGENQNDKSLKNQFNFQSMSSRKSGLTNFGFVQQEQWKANVSDYCLSSETKSLFESFQNMFQTLQFITQNIFGGDESQSLLSLSIQIEFFKGIKNYRALGICFNNMGNIHYNCSRYKEALESYSHALIYAQYEIELYKSIDSSPKVENQRENYFQDNSNHLINEPKSKEGLAGDTDSHQIQKENTGLKKYDFSKKYKKSQATSYSSNLRFRSQAKKKTLIQILNIEQNVQHPLLSILNSNQTISHNHNFTTSVKFKFFRKLSKQESEVLWWNIFNRKYNYCQALAGYLKDHHNNSISLWEEMEQIVNELLAYSSSKFLPQCHKRDMIILYQLSIALLHQNKVYQFLECLCIYEQIYNFSKESKHQAKIPSISKSIILQNLTPQKRGKLPLIQSQQPISLNNQHSLLQKTNTQQENQKSILNLFSTPQHNPLNNSQQNIEFPKIQPTAEHLDQQCLQNTLKNKFHLADAPLQLPCNFTLKHKEILKKKDTLFLTMEDSHILSSQQIEAAYFEEKATFHTIRGTQTNLFQISKNKSSITSEKNSTQEQQEITNQNNLIIDIHKINNETPKKLKTTQCLFFGKQQNQEQQQQQSSSDSQDREESLYEIHKQINSSQQDLNFNPQNQNDTNDSSLYDFQQQRSKTRNQSLVKSMKSFEKIAHYKFNMDIFAQYYTLQLSNLQTKIGNLSYSADILTKILERCYVYSPHLKKRILKKLNNIFISSKLTNPFLLKMQLQYEKLQKSNFKVCIITNVHKPLSKKQCLYMCKDMLKDILTRQQDQLSLITYQQEELIYLQQQMFTPVFIIKKQINRFQDILFKAFNNDQDSKQFYANSPLCSQNCSLTLNNPEQIKNIQSALSNFSQKLNCKSEIKQNDSQKLNQKNQQNTHEQCDDEFFSIHKMQKNGQVKNKSFQKQQKELNIRIQVIELNQENLGQQVSFKSVDNLNNLQSNGKLILDQSINDFNIENNMPQIFNSKLNSINSSRQFFYKNNLEEINNNFNYHNQDLGESTNQLQQTENFYINLREDQKQLNNQDKYFIKKLISNSNNNSKNQIKTIKTIQNSQIQFSQSKQQEKIQISQQCKQLERQLPKIKMDNSRFSSKIYHKTSLNKPSSFKKIYQQTDEKKIVNSDESLYNTERQNLTIKSYSDDEKKYSKFPSIDEICEQNVENQNLNLFQSSSNEKLSRDRISNSDFKNSIQEQKQQELIFHLGVHFALKREILNSSEKISFYYAQQKFGDFKKLSYSQRELLPSNYFKFHNSDSYPIQKTFLIYVTDQILIIRNMFLYKELCSLLYNLSIELLVLLENSYQSTLEQSIDQSIEIQSQNVIQFFTSQSKMLQYIYNQRDITNHRLYPTIVEQFQTNSFQ